MRRVFVLPALLTLTMVCHSTSIRAEAPRKVAGPAGPYLVLVDGGKKDEFLPAARALAALHGATVQRFDPTKLDQTLASLVEGVRTANVMLEPYMPATTDKLRAALGAPGGSVTPLEPLFPKNT